MAEEFETTAVEGQVRLFNKWTYDDVEIKDISLTDYIEVRHPVYLPHTAGRYQVKRFRKARCPITERMVNSLMMYGRNNGKKLMTVRIVKHAFEIIHLLTDANPIQILVDAVINTGPREDSTRIGSAGTVRRQAVDVSPLRRVNQAIHLLTTGAREAAFRNVKTIAECLADELINAAKGSSNSYAIKKKDELERVAKRYVTSFLTLNLSEAPGMGWLDELERWERSKGRSFPRSSRQGRHQSVVFRVTVVLAVFANVVTIADEIELAAHSANLFVPSILQEVGLVVWPSTWLSSCSSVLGARGYWRIGYDRFDCIIIALCIVQRALSNIYVNNNSLFSVIREVCSGRDTLLNTLKKNVVDIVVS
ncbi:ribosomal protein S5 [Irineochytrium annulatum]|nr:ribosomal protein S5 [Irineochytrium annulatum]